MTTGKVSMMKAVVALACLAGVKADGFSSYENILVTAVVFGSTSARNSTAAFFPGSDGGAPGMYSTLDSGATMTYTPELQGPMIPLAIAGDGESKLLNVGLFGAESSMDLGETFTRLSLPAKLVSSQSARYQSGLWAITGQFMAKTSDGIALSSDDMKTWNVVPVPGLYNDGGDLRYASFPSKSTFYATAGYWNDSSTQEKGRPLSANLHLSKETGKMNLKSPNLKSDGTGFWAQVVKTSDGGKTWQVVYENIDNGYYPNEIDCYDESTCTFVMEGLGQPKVMTTNDGGATWHEAFNDPTSVSLMATRMLSASEAWVAGGGDVGRMWHSKDLSDWSEYTTDSRTSAMFTSFDIDVTAGVIYGSGIMRSQLCSAVKATL